MNDALSLLPADGCSPAAPPTPRTPAWRAALALVGFAIVYYATVRVGLLLQVLPERISSVWPASGLVLAVLVLNPRRRWPRLLAVIFAVSLATLWSGGYSLPAALALALVNTVEPAVGAAVLARFCVSGVDFEHTTKVLGLLFVAGAVYSATALLGATVSLVILHGSFFHAWLIWWASNGLGVALLTPLIVAWVRERRVSAPSSGRRLVETLALIAGVTTFAFFFFSSHTVAETRVIRAYMLFPLLMWLAFRFAPRLVTSLLVLFSLAAILGTLHGTGGFVISGRSQTDNLVYLQLYLAAAACSTLLLNAEVTERLHAARALRASETNLAALNLQLERRVAERTFELESAVRELESFSYSVSHDLRTPLRALDGFSQILMEDYGDKLDAEARHHLQRIRAGAQRMATLINELLELSRLNRGEIDRRPVDLTLLAHEHVAELREAEPGRRVEVVIADNLRAGGDPNLTRALLANLLDNAWKFSARHETARIEVGALAGDETVFFVRDDGAGFDMAHSGLLFGAFQRLHAPDSFEGTGIGLATVQRIVHRHGGRIWAEAEVEKGATFYFTLPSQMAKR